MNSADEAAKRFLRAGVYAYLLVNGTSRVGAYAGTFTTADGRVVEASKIVNAVGATEVRRWMRGCMSESYQMLKIFDIQALSPRYVAKMASMNVSAANTFATADWLTNCPLFSPAEKQAHDASFTFSTTRAHASRGGTLDGVEERLLGKQVDAQRGEFAGQERAQQSNGW